MGFSGYRFDLVDHHAAHAIAAAYCSGFSECVVITLDGVGDGLSGSVWAFKDHHLTLVKAMPARVSFGIFFEHVTNLMNNRIFPHERRDQREQ